MKIEETPKFATPFEWIGGEDRMKALTERFYDLMDLERDYTELRSVRDQWLACMDQAMRETGVDETLRTRLNQSFFQTADWMRNAKV